MNCEGVSFFKPFPLPVAFWAAFVSLSVLVGGLAVVIGLTSAEGELVATPTTRDLINDAAALRKTVPVLMSGSSTLTHNEAGRLRLKWQDHSDPTAGILFGHVETLTGPDSGDNHRQVALVVDLITWWAFSPETLGPTATEFSTVVSDIDSSSGNSATFVEADVAYDRVQKELAVLGYPTTVSVPTEPNPSDPRTIE